MWLALVVIALYLPTLSFGTVDLDDGFIFTTDSHYYSDLHNLITSFSRSAYSNSSDIFYRPLTVNVTLLNYQLSDSGKYLWTFHLVNVLWHMIAVLLLYKLFIRLNVKNLVAFILTLLFAVQPALTEAVAWIPARNETLLAIFVFSFLIHTIDYEVEGKTRSLLLSSFFLLGAFFSKETAVFAPLVAVVLITLVLHKKMFGRQNFILYGIWTGCFVLWLAARTHAIANSGIDPVHLLIGSIGRLPLGIQYLGKMFLPFNLSVSPMQQDTVYYYGIIAILLIIITAILNKKRDNKVIIGGILIFILFMMPVFLLPFAVCPPTYEYRMYLPMFGIYLILTQTAIFKNTLKDKQLLMGGITVAILFAGINLFYQQSFDNPLVFWTQAVATAPNSAEANMRLAARTDDPEISKALFLKAFAINPREKHLNFIYGVMLQSKDSLLASEKYFLAEKTIDTCSECDLYLAHVAMEKKDLKGATAYLQSYLANNKANQMANDNLLLIYLDTDQEDNAKAQAQHMLSLGLAVPPSVRQHFHI